jgi:membrane protease YdiL (CAAX protease family)
MNTSITRLLLFFIPSVVLSNLVRFEVIDVAVSQSMLFDELLRILLEGVSVGLFALLAMAMLRRQQPLSVSFLGNAPVHAIVAAVATVALYIFMNRNALTLTPLVLFASFSLVYAIFEELGWRGYLFAELQNKGQWLQILGPGLLWYLWHLSFLQTTSVQANLVFLGICLSASWGLFGVVQSTRSILMAATLHFAFGAVFTNQILKSYWNSPDQYVFIGLAFSISLIAIKLYEKQTKQLASN